MSWQNTTTKNMLKKQIDHPLKHINEGKGPAVVFVHGAMGSNDNWEDNLPAFAEAGFGTYAVDLLGHGESSKPDDPAEYHIEEVYNHLVTWIEENNIAQPINFVGHSMGAHLIMVYALRNPGAVNKLVLVNPFYNPKQVNSWITMMGKRPKTSVKLLKVVTKGALNPFRGWRRNISRMLTARKIQMVVSDLQRMHPNIIYTTNSLWDLQPQLASINFDTLVVWGEKDRTLSPRSFPDLVKRLPNAQSLVFSTCGHTPQIDASETFNLRVIEFLR